MRTESGLEKKKNPVSALTQELVKNEAGSKMVE